MDAFAQPFAHRAQLLAALPGAIQAAEELQDDRRRGQRSIFDLMEADGEANGEPIERDGDDRCRTSRGGRTRSSSRPRRRRWTSTSPATRWPSSTRP